MAQTITAPVVDPKAEAVDLLLTHGFYLREDPQEQEVMRPYPPLGLLYLASHLKTRGLRVHVFDTTFRQRTEFDAALSRLRPPVVGIYANLLTRPSVLDMVRRSRDTGARVLVGGPEPGGYPDEYLSHGADVIVFGEGELTVEELLPRLASDGPHRLHDIPGIAFRDEFGRVVRTAPRASIADLDAQPFPDRAAIDIGEYIDAWRLHHGRGSVSLITARGCPYRCAWCSHGVFGYSHRRRSPLNVAEELAAIEATYRPDMVWYADDVFTINQRWLGAYAKELERRRLHVPFETISREDRLDEHVIRTLAAMGCTRVWIGSESGSQRMLDAMQRDTDAARVREMVRLLQKHGIEAGLFIMLGYEGEDLSDIEMTVNHLRAAPPDQVLTTVAYPIKGTPYYDLVADRILQHATWATGSDRQLGVDGRRSARFYRHATRWMVNAVAREQERRASRRDWPRFARTSLNAALGRVGMLLTRHEVEHA